MLWSDATVRKALELKFSCGSTGYTTILSQGLPYPSIRTLQRIKAENISFESGVLETAFDLLKLKVFRIFSIVASICFPANWTSQGPPYSQ